MHLDCILLTFSLFPTIRKTSNIVPHAAALAVTSVLKPDDLAGP